MILTKELLVESLNRMLTLNTLQMIKLIGWT